MKSTELNESQKEGNKNYDNVAPHFSKVVSSRIILFLTRLTFFNLLNLVTIQNARASGSDLQIPNDVRLISLVLADLLEKPRSTHNSHQYESLALSVV